MDALTYITDLIINQQTQGIQPEYVLIGRREADLLIQVSREFPMIAGKATEKSQLMGMQVVVDWASESRITVVEGFSHSTWLRRTKVERESNVTLADD